jgi:hypothetical protein
MNIPENTLQAIADAAFKNTDDSYCGSLVCRSINPAWEIENEGRRAVIQHALDNPALAPFLAGVGEYTDAELLEASNKAFREYCFGPEWRRAFLAALPRRESPALAEAIARAEKAEKELAVLKSSQLGILRPIAEMPEKVPDGCMAVFRWQDAFGSWVTGTREPTNGFFAILRLPAAEATPPAEPEPAAQVPLGPEDCPPGSALRSAKNHCFSVVYISSTGVTVFNPNGSRYIKWHDLQDEGWQINTSLPDIGRWDANAWKPCSKPGK